MHIKQVVSMTAARKCCDWSSDQRVFILCSIMFIIGRLAVIGTK